MSTYRVGYVGVEHHHRDPYFTIAADLPVEIVAVCEPGKDLVPADIVPLEDRPDEITDGGSEAERIARTADIYQDPTALIERAEIDLLWITYASDRAPEIIETAARAGIDVISEKPIARTAGELEGVAEAVSATGTTVIPTYFYRANPIVQDLRERVANDFFGDLWAIQGRFVGSQLTYRNTDHYIYDPARSRGGVLQWIGVHWLDSMVHVLDADVTRVHASMRTGDAAAVEEGAVLQFETEGGTMGTLHTGYYLDGTGKDTDLSLFGTDAQAWSPVHHDATTPSPTAPLELRSGRDAWSQAPTRTIEYEFAYDTFPAWGDYVHAFFADAITGLADGSPPATLEDAIRVLEILDAAYAAAESGAWEVVGEAVPAH